MAQTVKNLPAIRGTRVPSLGREDPLEEGMATHCSILAWRIPRTEEPGGLQFLGAKQSEPLSAGSSTLAGTQHRHEVQVIHEATPRPSLPPALISLVRVRRALGGDAAARAGVQEPRRAAGRQASGAARPCVPRSAGRAWKPGRQLRGHGPAAVGTGGTQAQGLQQLPGAGSRLRACAPRFSRPSSASTFPQART